MGKDVGCPSFSPTTALVFLAPHNREEGKREIRLEGWRAELFCPQLCPRFDAKVMWQM